VNPDRSLALSLVFGPVWHLYGLPTTYGTYGPYPDHAQIAVLPGSTVPEFISQVKTWPGGAGTKAYPAPTEAVVRQLCARLHTPA
jgi:hypothetical protein